MNESLFVGRSSERALLAELVHGVSAGAGAAVIVVGEQGIGKSALLRSGLAEAEQGHCRVLWATADEVDQAWPLGLLSAFAGNGWSRDAFARQGGPFAGDPVLAGTEQLLATLDELCADSPVVLVAEDLQWADAASLQAWSRLCQTAEQQPLLVVGSWRVIPDPEVLARQRDLLRLVRKHRGEVISLGALPEAALRDLVGSILGGQPGPQLTGLVSRLGGNPLYARELADGLLRADAITVNSGVVEVAARSAPFLMPASLVAAVTGRLHALPSQTSLMLQWSAMLGTEFSLSDLGVVTGSAPGQLIGMISQAVEAEVLEYRGSRLAFRHGLIRQVLHEGLTPAQRVEMQLGAGHALERSGAPPEQVARQISAALAVRGNSPAACAEAATGRSRADSGRLPAWVAQWLTGSAQALAYRAPALAAELLRAVTADLPESDDRRETLLASLVMVAFILGDDDEVQRTGTLLLGSAHQPATAAESAWLVGYALMRSGRVAQADQVIQAALTGSAMPDVWRARLTATHSLVLHALDSPVRAAQLAQDALAAAHQAGDRITLGYALHTTIVNAIIARDSTAVLTSSDQALAVMGDDPRTADLRCLVLSNKSACLADLDRAAEALTVARQALVIAERAGTHMLAVARFSLADQFFDLGQWDDALAELAAVELTSASYLPERVHGLCALIAGFRDDRQALREHLDSLPDQLAQTGGVWPASYHALWARAVAAERAGRLSAAVTILAAALEDSMARSMPGRVLLLPTLTRLALATGRKDTARAAADVARAEAEREAQRLKRALADHCAGLMNSDAAPVLAAAAYFGTAGRRFDQARSLADVAELQARNGNLGAARLTHVDAARLCDQVGARWEARRTARELRRHGLRLSETVARRPASGWESLTPTELRIASQVADGKSNPDIAAELVLSRNTVQTHVSHILTKLSARSRADIVRIALGRMDQAGLEPGKQDR